MRNGRRRVDGHPGFHRLVGWRAAGRRPDGAGASLTPAARYPLATGRGTVRSESIVRLDTVAPWGLKQLRDKGIVAGIEAAIGARGTAGAAAVAAAQDSLDDLLLAIQQVEHERIQVQAVGETHADA